MDRPFASGCSGCAAEPLWPPRPGRRDAAGAVCERVNRRREVAAAALGVAAYRDLEPFLDHPMDAVILVNYFDQHAPAAISALDD
jgi:predicted dehydrogenase